MDREVRIGDRAFVDGNEYIIHEIEGDHIYIKPLDSDDTHLVYFNGENWVAKGIEHKGAEHANIRFEPGPDMFQESNDLYAMIQILSELTYLDLINLCKTNKAINQICQNEELWKTKLWRDFRYIIFDDRQPKEVYSYVYNDIKDIEKTVNNANNAAATGNILLLAWLASHDIFPKNTYIDLAALSGHLGILKLMEEYGEYPSAKAASDNPHPEVVNWLNNRQIYPSKYVGAIRDRGFVIGWKFENQGYLYGQWNYRLCKSIPLKELKQIANWLGIPLESDHTRAELCDLIKTEMIERNLVSYT